MKQIEAILESFQLQTNKQAGSWLLFTDQYGWHSLAHRNRFEALRNIDDKLRERFELFTNVLWSILDAAEARFSSILPRLEELAAKAKPGPDDVTFLVPYLAPGTTASGRIFARLSSGWLTHLRMKGVFAHPPNLEVHDDQSFGFPPWPQSKYLERLATEVPADVVDTVLSIPHTNNETIHWDLLKATLHLPLPEAARVTIRVAEQLVTCNWLFSPLVEVVRKSAKRLIDQGEIAAAVAILRTTLAFRPEGQQRNDTNTQAAKLDENTYAEVVRDVLPALRKSDERAAVALLFELIDTGSDKSFEAHVAIGDRRSWNHKYAVDYLLDELRSIYVSAAGASEADLRRCVRELETRGGVIYRHLALHLLSLYGTNAPDLVVARASDIEMLDSLGSETREFSEMLAGICG